ncbi:MAG: DUF6445 family protein [Pseudomonadota bacterium]
MTQVEIQLSNTTTETVGNEGVEIIRVADVFGDPAAIVDAAAEASYAHINPHYPGIRAAVPAELLNQLCDAVSDLTAAHLDQPQRAWMGQAWYSIVTHAPAQLTPIQRLPHFDGFDEDQVAIMIYLNQTAHGGTAFYRQKDTGFERITEPRFPDYKAKLESGVRASGLPPAHYITDGAPHFEQIADFGAAYNSLILYPGTLLHSGVIDNNLALPSDPRTGRLTLNGFFRPA